MNSSRMTVAAAWDRTASPIPTPGVRGTPVLSTKNTSVAQVTDITATRAAQLALDTCLAAFEQAEHAGEWQDRIAALTRLIKLVKSFTDPIFSLLFLTTSGASDPQFNSAARQNALTCANCLATTLAPTLPSGVHQKALECYDVIFTRLGGNAFEPNPMIWTLSFLAFSPHASVAVRKSFLSIIERFIIPFPQAACILDSTVIALLACGMDEESNLPIVHALMNRLIENQAIGIAPFLHSVLLAFHITALRLAAVKCLWRFVAKISLEDFVFMIQSPKDFVTALVLGLSDTHGLVVRGTLDILLSHFSLSNPIFDEHDKKIVTQHALRVVLKRNMALNRRFYSWALFSNQLDYITTVVFKEVLIAHAQKCAESSSSSVILTIQETIKILLLLLDKADIGNPTAERVLPYIFPLLCSLIPNDGVTWDASTSRIIHDYLSAVEPFLLWGTIYRIRRDSRVLIYMKEILRMLHQDQSTHDAPDADIIIHYPMLICVFLDLASQDKSGDLLEVVTICKRLFDQISLPFLHIREPIRSLARQATTENEQQHQLDPANGSNSRILSSKPLFIQEPNSCIISIGELPEAIYSSPMSMALTSLHIAGEPVLKHAYSMLYDLYTRDKPWRKVQLFNETQKQGLFDLYSMLKKFILGYGVSEELSSLVKNLALARTSIPCITISNITLILSILVVQPSFGKNFTFSEEEEYVLLKNIDMDLPSTFDLLWQYIQVFGASKADRFYTACIFYGSSVEKENPIASIPNMLSYHGLPSQRFLARFGSVFKTALDKGMPICTRFWRTFSHICDLLSHQASPICGNRRLMGEAWFQSYSGYDIRCFEPFLVMIYRARSCWKPMDIQQYAGIAGMDLLVGEFDRYFDFDQVIYALAVIGDLLSSFQSKGKYVLRHEVSLLSMELGLHLLPIRNPPMLPDPLTLEHVILIACCGFLQSELEDGIIHRYQLKFSVLQECCLSMIDKLLTGVAQNSVLFSFCTNVLLYFCHKSVLSNKGEHLSLLASSLLVKTFLALPNACLSSFLHLYESSKSEELKPQTSTAEAVNLTEQQSGSRAIHPLLLTIIIAVNSSQNGILLEIWSPFLVRFFAVTSLTKEDFHLLFDVVVNHLTMTLLSISKGDLRFEAVDTIHDQDKLLHLFSTVIELLGKMFMLHKEMEKPAMSRRPSFSDQAMSMVAATLSGITNSAQSQLDIRKEARHCALNHIKAVLMTVYNIQNLIDHQGFPENKLRFSFRPEQVNSISSAIGVFLVRILKHYKGEFMDAVVLSWMAQFQPKSIVAVLPTFPLANLIQQTHLSTWLKSLVNSRGVISYEEICFAEYLLRTLPLVAVRASVDVADLQMISAASKSLLFDCIRLAIIAFERIVPSESAKNDTHSVPSPQTLTIKPSEVDTLIVMVEGWVKKSLFECIQLAPVDSSEERACIQRAFSLLPNFALGASNSLSNRQLSLNLAENETFLFFVDRILPLCSKLLGEAKFISFASTHCLQLFAFPVLKAKTPSDNVHATLALYLTCKIVILAPSCLVAHRTILGEIFVEGPYLRDRIIDFPENLRILIQTYVHTFSELFKEEKAIIEIATRCTTNSGMFISKEQDLQARLSCLYKLALVLFAGPLDQVTLVIPKLVPVFLKLLKTDVFRPATYLCIRILFSRVSHVRLEPLWTVILQDLTSSKASQHSDIYYHQCRMLYFLALLEDGVFKWWGLVVWFQENDYEGYFFPPHKPGSKSSTRSVSLPDQWVIEMEGAQVDDEIQAADASPLSQACRSRVPMKDLIKWRFGDVREDVSSDQKNARALLTSLMISNGCHQHGHAPARADFLMAWLWTDITCLDAFMVGQASP